MTVAIAILADDGIVVASDTEETWTHAKGTVPKISAVNLAERPGNATAATLAVTGAGDGHYLETAAQKLEDMFQEGQNINGQWEIPALHAAIEAEMVDFHAKHVAPFAGFPEDMVPDFNLLVASQIDGDPFSRQGIFIADGTAVREVRKGDFAAGGRRPRGGLT